MKYISKILLSLSIATMGLVAQPVCSDKVVSELTSKAKITSSNYLADGYIIKIHSVEGSIVKAWVLILHAPTNRKDYIKLDSKFSNLGYSKELRAYDFSNETSATLSRVAYSCNGEVIHSTSTPYESYDVIVPDSVAEAEMETVKEMVNKSSSTAYTKVPAYIGIDEMQRVLEIPNQ